MSKLCPPPQKKKNHTEKQMPPGGAGGTKGGSRASMTCCGVTFPGSKMRVKNQGNNESNNYGKK